ncbi:MAG: zinc metallopeptidase [Bacteroidales bacterium]|nr:zinc metallopeptidase [Lentimicrobiaceae bacterium]MDD5693991.1 zinc metallopeptidase [Bacteroidales bacterium]
MIGAYIIGAIFAVVGLIVGQVLQAKFKKYSRIPLRNGMSGREIAEKMLADNGITDVQVTSVRGHLSDHYNPTNKTINLSESVYSQRSAAAAAVAAHETGHALQHATAYRWLTMRSKMVPVVSFSSQIVQWIILGGIILINSFPSLLLIGILLFAVVTLFSIVTLPVEYNASKRALAWMQTRNVVTSQEFEGAKDSLNWAARTYLVAALGSIASLLYYLMIYMGRRD